MSVLHNKKSGVTLLIIDAQNDFANSETGSLYVPNGYEDSVKVANFIRESIDNTNSALEGTNDSNKNNVKIDRIVVSLDTHHKLHIAHPTFWEDKDGKHPDPFANILSSQIEDGTWKPTDEAVKDSIDGNFIDLDVVDEGVKDLCFDKDGNLDLVSYCIQYTKLIEEGGRFKLTIWPEHCLIGTEGNEVVKVLQDALNDWEDATNGKVEIVRKGQNNLTEMYSALCAEVPITKETQFNKKLFDSLNMSKKIVVVGEAKSHCVNYTTRDMLKNMKESEKEKVYLLSDCSSPVPGCESASEEFENHVTEQGGTVLNIDEVETIFQ